jgi:hypothetical protein
MSMTHQKIGTDWRRDEAHRGIVVLELLAAWSVGGDAPMSDEDADWLDEQVGMGMLERDSLPPDVFQRVMQIHESVEMTEQLMRRCDGSDQRP